MMLKRNWESSLEEEGTGRIKVDKGKKEQEGMRGKGAGVERMRLATVGQCLEERGQRERRGRRTGQIEQGNDEGNMEKREERTGEGR
eukprot:765109-Hanusia_phi.AAC.3